MRTKIVLVAVVLAGLAAAPLAASEAVWEVRVPAALPVSAFVVPDPLPHPTPLPIEPLEALAVPAPVFAAPVRVPVYKPGPRSGQAFFDANLLLLVGLNVADYVSTRQALRYPGLTETNPLMKPFVKSPAVFAAVKLGTTALSCWSMKALFKKNKTVAWIMTTASNALLSYAVANNYRLIRGARAH